MNKKPQNAISPTRSEDYAEWYQQVVRAGEMAETSPARGCMVIKPWGYGIWENIHRLLDARIKATGHENAYFPLFIPLSLLEREAKHVEGFAKECAVVTHHRLEEKNGKLIPTAELDEPLVVRPTSETIIGETYAKWIQSYRDLPVLINQWANVVRWEMRPRLFLRTAEFLWQEGHTVHATEAEGREETLKMLEVYRDFVENDLGIPLIVGEKTEGERFPGAVNTYCIEAMMQDRRALQAGTSHYLGQNFAEAYNIRFLNEKGELEYGYTTSWGVSTRLIGGMIMAHGDDDGLRVPPAVAPKHVVILPVVPKPETEEQVMQYADKIADMLKDVTWRGAPVVVHIDKRDIRGGEKNWQWIKKGVPVRIEVGPKDVENGAAVVNARHKGHKDKQFVQSGELAEMLPGLLDEIQDTYFAEAKSYRDENMRTDITSTEEFFEFFKPENMDKPEIHGGFVLGKWCNDPDEEAKLNESKITVRCLPLEQSGTKGKCVVTGKETTVDAVFAKSYQSNKPKAMAQSDSSGWAFSFIFAPPLSITQSYDSPRHFSPFMVTFFHLAGRQGFHLSAASL